MFGPLVLDVAPTQAIWQSLYSWYVYIGTAAGTLVMGWLVYNIVRYRAKGEAPGPQRKHKEETWRGALVTVAISGTLLFLVEFQTFASIPLMVPPTTPNSLHIGVIARQWSWTFVYPNGAKSSNLTVPINTVIILNLTSVDVDHSFFIANFDVGIDAIPGRTNTLWFKATQPGVSIIRCKELCGVGHAIMFSFVVALQQSDYQAFYTRLGGH
jgi:cytochrome c oxidase subunit 2